MDVKQGQNNEGKTMLYSVFEYMDTDLKKFIRSFHQTGSLMFQLCNDVAFYHGHGILHRALEVLLGVTHYSMAVNMWSVGCIFAKLVAKQALFPSDSELQKLLYIFRLLGTPKEEVWPGMSKLMNWLEYPQWSPQSLSKAVPNLDELGLDLLSQMLKYEPSKWISAKKPMDMLTSMTWTSPIFRIEDLDVKTHDY